MSGSGGSDAGPDSGPMSGSGGSCAAGSAGCQDLCPTDDDKTDPGACGCGMSESDGDADGTPDCIDDCAEDPDKKTPGECGCGAPDVDGDGDGSSDCADGCPADAAKTEPGGCGCGMAESSADGDTDGTLDCVDGCPQDMLKTAPLTCGCGMPETDGDDDGTPNCMDQCASDPGKTAPGGCGCGVPDADSGAVVGCLGLKNTLVRRYMFEGSGASAADSKGGAAGTITGGTQTGGGVNLSGSNQYVTLPDNIISPLTNATIEMWVTWTGSSAWQRLFDFGSNNGTSGTSYLFLTPRGTPAPDDVMLLVFRAAGATIGEEVRVRGTRILPSGQLHVAVVVDDTNNTLSFYLNSTLEGSAPFGGERHHLSEITDVSNWLGRSQYSVDPELAGTIHEVRIYNAALTPAQLNFSLTNGLDPAYLRSE